MEPDGLLGSLRSRKPPCMDPDGLLWSLWSH